ncbi:MAG: hypothetical protein JXR56_05000 [Candidatus Cloacimonetes bacterium]|nr:hypothetical protein [Candidatus Cloacimonadota bacterium]
MELFSTIISKKEPPLLTRARVYMMYDNIEFSADRAKELLGFEPETPLPIAIEKTVTWYKLNGYLGNPEVK